MKQGVISHLKSVSHFNKQKKQKNRLCKLCAEEFYPRTAFERYCTTCKKESELLKFSEWLPTIDEVVREKIPA
jgi:hypothetical protein